MTEASQKVQALAKRNQEISRVSRESKRWVGVVTDMQVPGAVLITSQFS